jgi:multicomponent Na+:H+ antiporter subunit C
MTIVLALAAAGLFAVGTYLVLQRKLSRIIIGLALISHGANVLLLASGRDGLAPLLPDGPVDVDRYADPLPQAMALTTIVITFGVTALLLAMAYRRWLLDHDDDVPDDLTDRAVARGGWRDQEVDDERDVAAERSDDEADEIDGAGR